MEQMQIDIKVNFFSYFKDLTECESTVLQLPQGTNLDQALSVIRQQYPKMERMKRSTLAAVDLEYVAENHILEAGEEISLFPPVQGG
ncbi:MoaD/ThiS family protein [bacterium]|jgi:molybdopterin converting factor small subunit|nr:MoaD/ThiS family protein [Verrucomicrobiota bacterium]MDB4484998.1 MoaD/ThiS family protein [bacterium]MDB4688898.1 MoaD/ThiS family protein [Verrucomicrobiota bacterium]MDC0266600.1 MoaD/ThiS family protein [bacterium]MDC0292757.1 MoaD/ThiS family protein [Verrucomicrobiota bacterium]